MEGRRKLPDSFVVFTRSAFSAACRAPNSWCGFGVMTSTLVVKDIRLSCACSTKSTLLSPNKMIFRLANRSSHALPTRTSQLLRRHQSTAPQAATTAQSLQAQQLQARQRQQLIAQQILAQQLQAQQSPIAEIAKHPSAVSHPALSEQPTQRGGGDNSIVFIFGGLLLGGIPLSYWYWGYREQAMKRKKEEMLRGIQERYAARHGGGG